MNVWTLVGLGFNAAIISMAVAWVIGRRLKNAGYIEACWPFAFAAVVWFYALAGAGAPFRKILIAVLVSLWAVRLGVYLVSRVARNHKVEDIRYQQLREQFPKRPWHMFFGFAQLQAVLIGLLSVPLAIACFQKAPALAPVEIAAIVLWVIGWVGETVADRQLDRFRRQPENAGRVYAGGLWRFSRHPNYFFEWLIWVAYFLFAVTMPGGWSAVYVPLLMLLLLTRVTGLPATESRILHSRESAYREYQRRTSPFVPWFPRKIRL
jgi:steroid 5-alpha reductase family enzyme